MKQYFFTLLLSFMWIPSFGKTVSDELQERVYVQTDKQLYLAGEQIRMKILTVDTELIPLVFSTVAYAELVRDSMARVQIKVALTDGVGEGRMSLPVDLKTGYYRLIAYTQYMRNEGTEVFFEKNIVVVNTFQQDYNPGTANVTNTPYKDLQSVLSQLSSFNFQLSTPEAVSLQPDKSVYSTREQGFLTLSGLPATIHTLSVSISGIEMNTTASSSFQNKPPKNTTGFTDEYLPEYEGHIITGTIIDNQTGTAGIDNAPLIPVISFLGKEINFFTGQKSPAGEVLFVTSGNYDTKEIAAVVYNGDEKYRIDLRSPFITRFAPKPMPELYIDSTFYDQLLERSVALQTMRYFINDSIENNNMSGTFYKTKPTNSYLLDEYTRFPTMQEVFTECISSARFRRRDEKRELSVIVRNGDNSYYGSNPLVLLDGAPVSNHEHIYNYNPLLVECINIYNSVCILGGYSFEGIIELKTYRGLAQDLDFEKSTQIIRYEGPQRVESFRTPDYSTEQNRKNRMPDSHHTLLWNPDIQTAGQTTILLPFETSDFTGEFQAIVEGVTEEGQVVFTTSFFIVE